MNRIALLIETAAADPTDPVRGAVEDVDNLKAWLMSNAGGAWEDDGKEIITLHNPTCDLTRQWLAHAAKHKYAFVTFAGHGGQERDTDHDESTLLFQDGMLTAGELNCGADRCTVLIDSCRWHGEEVFSESIRKAMGVVKYARDRSREQHRNMFDAALGQTEKGVIYMFACEAGEFANGASRTGGYYTRYLIEGCRAWYASSADAGAIDTRAVHEWAAGMVNAKAAQQHPQYYPGRRRGHYPLAVRA